MHLLCPLKHKLGSHLNRTEFEWSTFTLSFLPPSDHQGYSTPFSVDFAWQKIFPVIRDFFAVGAIFRWRFHAESATTGHGQTNADMYGCPPRLPGGARWPAARRCGIRLARPTERCLWDAMVDRRHCPGPALCGDPARAVAGAGRLAGRCVQVRAARPLDRPGAGTAVPASRPERGQHPVFGSRGARRAAGPRLVLSRGDDPPALPRPVSVHGHGIPGSGPSGIRNCTAAPCTGPRAGTARAPPGARPRQRRLHRPAWKAEADAGAAPAPRRPPPSGAPRPPAAGCGAAGRSRPGAARPRDDAPAPRRTGGHRCLAEQKDRPFRTAGQVDGPQGVGGGGPRGTGDVLRRWSGTGRRIARAPAADGRRIRAANRNGAGHPGRWH